MLFSCMQLTSIREVLFCWIYKMVLHFCSSLYASEVKIKVTLSKICICNKTFGNSRYLRSLNYIYFFFFFYMNHIWSQHCSININKKKRYNITIKRLLLRRYYEQYKLEQWHLFQQLVLVVFGLFSSLWQSPRSFIFRLLWMIYFRIDDFLHQFEQNLLNSCNKIMIITVKTTDTHMYYAMHQLSKIQRQ